MMRNSVGTRTLAYTDSAALAYTDIVAVACIDTAACTDSLLHIWVRDCLSQRSHPEDHPVSFVLDADCQMQGDGRQEVRSRFAVEAVQILMTCPRASSSAIAERLPPACTSLPR